MGLRQRLAAALEKAHQAGQVILTTKSTLMESEFLSEKAFSEYGLTKTDLKKLERLGLAVSGRKPTASGHRTLYILIAGE